LGWAWLHLTDNLESLGLGQHEEQNMSHPWGCGRKECFKCTRPMSCQSRISRLHGVGAAISARRARETSWNGFARAAVPKVLQFRRKEPWGSRCKTSGTSHCATLLSDSIPGARKPNAAARPVGRPEERLTGGGWAQESLICSDLLGLIRSSSGQDPVSTASPRPTPPRPTPSDAAKPSHRNLRLSATG
jgi:hypothetical protein